MNKRKIYRVHKWIAVTVGVFFLTWLVSGIVMVLPTRFYAAESGRKPAPVDYRNVTISPAEAVNILARVMDSHVEVASMSLKRIGDAIVYRITLEHDGTHVINARSGEVFTVSREIAEQIARDEFPVRADVLQVNLVNRHNLTYPWGPIPAYEIVFDDGQSTISHVSVSDGTVRRSTRWSRIQAAIASLHTFEPLRLITKREAVRKGLLVLLSLLGVGVAGTGYYLSIPRRKISRKKLSSDLGVPRNVSDDVRADLEARGESLTPSFHRRQ